MERAARRAQARMRLMTALEALTSTIAVDLLAVAAAVTVAKLVPDWRGIVGGVLLSAALAALAAVIYGASRPVPRFAGAMALDAYHGLSDRLASALAFAGLPPEKRTRLMDLAIEDACENAHQLSPRRAVPLRLPRHAAASVGFLAGVILLIALRPTVPRPLVPVKTIEPVVLSGDDIDLFREVGQKLSEKDKTPEVLAALKAYNELIEDIAKRRLDRNEAFRRMAEVEQRLDEGRGIDAKSLEEELKVRAAALKNSPLSRPVAEALDQQDLAKAEQKMRELAQRLRDKPDSVAKAEVERLRQAMKNAAEGQKERLAALERRREELQQELLRRKEEQRDGGGSQEERSLLEKKERELERLDREKQGAEKSGRQLDRLDRDLARAAEDLMREMGMSADDLDQGAEDINRLSQERMSDQEREELRQRLEDLREQLRQAGQDGRERMARLRRFSRQARGQGQDQGQGSKQKSCDPGDPNCQEGQERGEGQEGQTSEGEGAGQMLQLGQSGEITLQMGQGQSQGQPTEQGQGQGQGHGEGPPIKGKATDPSGMKTMDVQAAGLDTGRGATRSEVIYGASEKGFRGGAYKKVYTEYRTSAEEQMHEDRIPPGGSEHIRRYFDLIRPRE